MTLSQGISIYTPGSALSSSSLPLGVDKTTLVKKVCAAVGKQRGDVKMNGFYTEEVREGGRGGRVGFDVVTLEGERGVLARISGYVTVIRNILHLLTPEYVFSSIL